MHTYIDKSIQKYTKERNTRQGVIHVHVLASHTCARAHAHAHINTHIDESTHKHTLTQIQIHALTHNYVFFLSHPRMLLTLSILMPLNICTKTP